MDHSEVKYLPTTDYTPAEFDEIGVVLLLAAALIEKQGWFPADGPYGTVCAALAIQDVCKDQHRGCANDARARFAKAVGLVDGYCTTIGPWNDRQTKEIVVSKLRAVALNE